MSNLGMYQILTSWAKKVGGPQMLIAIIAGSGALLGATLMKGCSTIKNKITDALKKKKQLANAEVIYTVFAEGTSNEGLQFNINDQFNVLERDGDAGLISIIGDNNNPYFVSLSFLSTISDYVVT